MTRNCGRKRAITTAFVVASSGLFACPSSRSGASGGGGARKAGFPNDSAGCQKYKPCEVLTANEINKALGGKLDSGGHEVDVGRAPDVAIACTYQGGGLVTTINISCLAKGGNGPETYAAAGKPEGMPSMGLAPPVVTAVDGLGDEHAWFRDYPPPIASLGRSYQLTVFFGAGSRFTISYSLPPDSHLDPLKAGKEMANLVLGKL
jgi:hypothetical protein